MTVAWRALVWLLAGAARPGRRGVASPAWSVAAWASLHKVGHGSWPGRPPQAMTKWVTTSQDGQR
ncbi:hypothetical protein ACIBQX_49115 [Nonomuraea sp. NPDC049714]|uniref:hypothetical protein n=1 Tax=Nonomuraea sp. NPDC049714 TaxID=3364357 RepID=UPI0037ABFDAF